MTIYEIINSLEMLNPLLVYIEKFEKDESKNLIIKPKSSKEKETLSSRWGKVLRVSAAPLEDDFMEWRRKQINIGSYVRFNPNNPVFGPSDTHKKICCVGVDDIFDQLSEETFNELVTLGDEHERGGNFEPVS